MPSKRYQTLEAVRGVLALYVFLGHLYAQIPSSTTDSGLLSLLLYGRSAVTVFVVLSGFSLTLPVVSQGRQQSYTDFLQRRWRRLAPGYYGTILVTFVLRWFQWREMGLSLAIPLQAWVSNLLFMTDFDFAANSWFSQTFWSMAVEVKLLLLFPLLLWCHQRYGNITLLLCASAIALLWSIPGWLYPSLPMEHIAAWYVLPFCCGIVAAQAITTRFKPRWWLISSGLAIVILFERFHWTPEAAFSNYSEGLCWTDLAIGVFTASLLLWLVQWDAGGVLPLYVRWLQWEPLLWVGSWSYSLYLLHHPLSLHLARWLAVYDLRGWSAIALETIPVLTLCYLFSLVFERPFVSRADK